jgi:hypothetical protein
MNACLSPALFTLRVALAISAVSTALTPAASHAQTILGTEVTGIARSLEVTCGTCPTPVIVISSDSDGGPDAPAAMVFFEDRNRVSYSAKATVSGPKALPSMGVFAKADILVDIARLSTFFHFATAKAEQTQAYIYRGSVPATYTLEFVLDGQVIGGPFSELFGGFAIYGSDFNPGDPPIGSSFELVRAIPGPARNVLLTGSVTFDVAPGDTFFLVAEMFATADSRDQNEAEIDAANTLEMRFTAGDTSLLTPLLTEAPVTTVQPPHGLRVSSIVGNSVTLRWEAPAVGPTPTDYVLEGGVSPGQALVSIPIESAVPSVTIDVPTGSFYARVRTVSDGMVSAPSEEIQVHVNVPVEPSPPEGLVGLVNGSELALAWRNTFGGGASTEVLLDVSGALTLTIPLGMTETFRFTDVPAGTYTLRIRGRNSGGASVASNPVTLTFPAACSGAPLRPINFLAYKTGTTITVVWDPAANGPAATGFVVNATGPFSGSIPTTARTLSGPVPPGSYRLSVHATNACGASQPTAEQVITVP